MNSFCMPLRSSVWCALGVTPNRITLGVIWLSPSDTCPVALIQISISPKHWCVISIMQHKFFFRKINSLIHKLGLSLSAFLIKLSTKFSIIDKIHIYFLFFRSYVLSSLFFNKITVFALVPTAKHSIIICLILNRHSFSDNLIKSINIKQMQISRAAVWMKAYVEIKY